MADQDTSFSLIPADDDVDEQEDVDAAAASALDDLPPAEEDVPDPTGYTWAFDFEAGRFIRHGQSPARVNGFETIKQRIYMALNSARYAHGVFSDQFGVESPQHGIGTAGFEAIEAAQDWKKQIRDALLIDEEINDVQVSPRYDPLVGAIILEDLVVTTNEEVELSFPDIKLTFDSEA